MLDHPNAPFVCFFVGLIVLAIISFTYTAWN